MLNNLYHKYLQAKEAFPKLRARDLAEKLNISEAKLVATCIGNGVTLLKNDFEDLLKDAVKLGSVMALTRNEHCVHERHGVYHGANFFNMGTVSRMGLLVNPDIDLRLFMQHWQYAFAVEEGDTLKPRKSLQFFDKFATAVHKIYVTPKSDVQAYEFLVAKYRSPNQSISINPETYNPATELPDDQIDWPGFRKAWSELKDLHDFHGLTRKFKVSRKQAYTHVGDDYAWKVTNSSARQVLNLASVNSCSIMIFVGNRGCIQIHTGEVQKIIDMYGWLNVLDSEFNLHLQEDSIGSSWVIKRPSVDGMITSLELFGKDNNTIITFFGKRKPGIPEMEAWRDIIKQLPAV